MPSPLTSSPFMFDEKPHESNVEGRANARARRVALRLSLVAPALLLCAFAAQTVSAQVTVTPVTWNVIGLDSNKWSQGVGPDTFQIGARACNVGSTAVSNVTGTFVWDSANPYINLAGSTLNPVT